MEQAKYEDTNGRFMRILWHARRTNQRGSQMTQLIRVEDAAYPANETIADL
jgi:hypothetical protein